jgi:hypothetical protein
MMTIGILAAISTKKKIFLAVGLVVLAFFILAMSLQSSNLGFSPVQYAPTTQQPLSKMLSREMIPGNPLYLLLMVKDAVVLDLTLDPMKNAWLRVEYANRRLGYAKTLLNKHEGPLAINTIAKAEIYLGKAVELIQRNDPSQLSALQGILVQHQQALRDAKAQLSDEDQARVDSLLHYNESLVQTISRH